MIGCTQKIIQITSITEKHTALKKQRWSGWKYEREKQYDEQANKKELSSRYEKRYWIKKVCKRWGIKDKSGIFLFSDGEVI